MNRGRLAAGVLLGFNLISSTAVAQESREFSVVLRAAAEHDTNVARVSKPYAQIQGIKPDDWLFTPSVSVNAILPVGRQTLFLNGGAGYSFYENNNKLDRERLDFTGGLRKSFGICRTTIGGTYNRGLNQIEDPLLFATVENIQQLSRAEFDLNCSRGTGLGATFTASKEWSKNDQPLVKQSDYESSMVRAGLTYSRPALGTLTVFGSQTETDYNNRVFADGYTMKSVGLTFDRQLGARIQGSVTVAYATVAQNGPMSPGIDRNSENFTYAAAVSYRANENLRFNATFDQSVNPSTGFGRTYDLTTSYRLAADYAIGSRIALGAGIGRIERASEGPIGDPILALTDSTTQTYFGSVSYRQSDRLSFVLRAAREDRTANLPQFEYVSDRIGLTAELNF